MTGDNKINEGRMLAIVENLRDMLSEASKGNPIKLNAKETKEAVEALNMAVEYITGALDLANNNMSLREQINNLMERFQGYDPEHIRELVIEQQTLWKVIKEFAR